LACFGGSGAAKWRSKVWSGYHGDRAGGFEWQFAVRCAAAVSGKIPTAQNA
jgi:hypothetical protein